jgi:hypothetical protein
LSPRNCLSRGPALTLDARVRRCCGGFTLVDRPSLAKPVE